MRFSAKGRCTVRYSVDSESLKRLRLDLHQFSKSSLALNAKRAFPARLLLRQTRLAAFLLNLSQRLNRRGYSSRDFVLKMRREEIGSYLGLRRETICRGIAHLCDQGLVETTGRDVTIQNMDGLKQLVVGCHRPRC
jgi:CRP-like cAMP-binding protein